tara:strand:+ start:66 stop:503 length:438 start_codon:yes stop_codon:yes gene_type:complete
MGASNAGSNGSNDTQVSGYEAEINKQKAKEKAQKEAFGKYDKSNTNPNDNIQKQKKKTVTTTNNDNGGDYNPIIKEVTETAPTVAEVDEATTDTAPIETAETTEANKKLKIKKKGRYQSIMTSAKGVTKASSDYTLGVKNLLGRV